MDTPAIPFRQIGLLLVVLTRPLVRRLLGSKTLKFSLGIEMVL